MKSLTVNAEVAGPVCKIAVYVGDSVKSDQELVILESMKMEIPVTAAMAGVVRKILIELGQGVTEGQGLVVIEGH